MSSSETVKSPYLWLSLLNCLIFYPLILLSIKWLIQYTKLRHLDLIHSRGKISIYTNILIFLIIFPMPLSSVLEIIASTTDSFSTMSTSEENGQFKPSSWNELYETIALVFIITLQSLRFYRVWYNIKVRTILLGLVFVFVRECVGACVCFEVRRAGREVIESLTCVCGSARDLCERRV